MIVVVRKAEKEDAASIAGFAVALFAQHRDYDRERFADIGDLEGARHYYLSRIEAESAEVLIAELNGKPVGFAYLEYEAIDYAMLLEKAAWVHDLYVDEAARGSGAGRMLIEAAKVAAQRFGAEKIVLTVAEKNAFARTFFIHQGFRRTMVEMTMDLVVKQDFSVDEDDDLSF